MIGPGIGTGIEESDQVAVRFQNGTEIAPLISIANEARISQVLGDRGSAMLLDDDMIDFAAKEGVILVDKAVFTAPNSPEHDQAA